MIKIAPVNYTNTYPLIHFLDEMPSEYQVEITPNIPSKVAQKLLNNEVDLALIPVAALADLDSYQIVGRHGIAADDYVASVCLFSNVPIDQVQKVYLDFHSMTSSRLVRWLLKNHWNQKPKLIDTHDDTFIGEIKADAAALVIGDRAFPLLGQYEYIYDLAHEWRLATSLPFVFAVWASRKTLKEDFVREFERLQEKGLQNIDQIISEYGLESAAYDMHKYYQQNIQYRLDASHKQSMDLFLDAAI